MRQAVEQAAPLHDIGKVAVPDAILNKPGKLTADEFEVMKGHAAAGADTLTEVCRQYQFASAFLYTAREIARSHHEKWNGRGYPDGTGAARPSRSPPASWPWPTCTTPSAPRGCTSRHIRTPRR